MKKNRNLKSTLTLGIGMGALAFLFLGIFTSTAATALTAAPPGGGSATMAYEMPMMSRPTHITATTAVMKVTANWVTGKVKDLQRAGVTTPQFLGAVDEAINKDQQLSKATTLRTGSVTTATKAETTPYIYQNTQSTPAPISQQMTPQNQTPAIGDKNITPPPDCGIS